MPPGKQVNQASFASFSKDIARISDLLRELDPLVKNFRHDDFGKIRELSSIHNLFIDSESQIELVISACYSTPVFSIDESKAILDYVAQASVAVQVLLNDVGLSRLEFDHAILRVFSISPVIKGHIDKLDSLFSSLFVNLKNLLDASLVPSLENTASKIRSAFGIQATVVYSQVCSFHSPYKVSLIPS